MGHPSRRATWITPVANCEIAVILKAHERSEARADRGRAGRSMDGDQDSKKPAGLAEPAPHYLGHRERLRERFLRGGSAALADYELIELVLFRAIGRRDLKPLAKELL